MSDQENFERSLVFVLKWEGGLTDDKDDPGGLTNFGINQRDHPNVDIRNLTRESAAAIYRRDYWDRSHCNILPWPACLVVFDSAVNCGTGRSVEWFKEGSVVDALVDRFRHYLSLAWEKPKFRKFFRGWMNRLVDLCATVFP
jgi:lysozyme family protein